jgi:hypothetical protein
MAYFYYNVHIINMLRAFENDLVTEPWTGKFTEFLLHAFSVVNVKVFRETLNLTRQLLID